MVTALEYSVGQLTAGLLAVPCSTGYVCTVFLQKFPRRLFFFESLKCRKFRLDIEIILPLCNENLNNFLTRPRKLFKGGKYSREEIILGNRVCYLRLCDRLRIIFYDITLSKTFTNYVNTYGLVVSMRLILVHKMFTYG